MAAGGGAHGRTPRDGRGGLRWRRGLGWRGELSRADAAGRPNLRPGRARSSRPPPGRPHGPRGPWRRLSARPVPPRPVPARALSAGVGLVRPLLLDRIGADPLGLPGADVADLPVNIVIPALARNRIGDGLAELVRARRGERVERR